MSFFPEHAIYLLPLSASMLRLRGAWGELSISMSLSSLGEANQQGLLLAGANWQLIPVSISDLWKWNQLSQATVWDGAAAAHDSGIRGSQQCQWHLTDVANLSLHSCPWSSLFHLYPSSPIHSPCSWQDQPIPHLLLEPLGMQKSCLIPVSKSVHESSVSYQPWNQFKHSFVWGLEN